jgi:hypothetical protein
VAHRGSTTDHQLTVAALREKTHEVVCRNPHSSALIEAEQLIEVRLLTLVIDSEGPKLTKFKDYEAISG